MKALAISLFMFCAIHISAQELPGRSAIPPAGSVLEAHFTQFRHLNGIPKPIKSEGDVILWHGRGLIWKTLSPFPNTLLITKKGLYQLENQIKTPLLKAGGDSALFNVMAEIFTMNDESQIKGFTVEKLPLSNNNWRIKLLPQYEQVKNFIQSITVEGNVHITRMTITRPNGDHDEIDIKDHVLIKSPSVDLREIFDE